MIKPILFFTFFTIIILSTSISHASGDAGFVIRYKNFSLEIRYNIIETEGQVTPLNSFLLKPDFLFYDCLNWVYRNKANLEYKKQRVELYFEPSKKQFSISGPKTRNYITYKLKNVREIVLSTIAKKLDIEYKSEPLLEKIPFCYIYTRAYIEDQFQNSDLFWGSIPGYMYNKNDHVYFLMNWRDTLRDKKVKHNKIAQFSVKQINISKSNISSIFEPFGE